MSEPRRDPVTRDRAIVDPGRAQRPEDSARAPSNTRGACSRRACAGIALDQARRPADHRFIDLLPRPATPAGFELGSRIAVNPRTRERAAAGIRARLEAIGGA